MTKWVVISYDHETEVKEYEDEAEARIDFDKLKSVGVVYVTLAQVLDTTLPTEAESEANWARLVAQNNATAR